MPKRKRGFAAINAARVKEIASMGGKKALALGVLHVLTPAELKKGGDKAGRIVAERPGHMAAIGKLGGEAKARNKKKRNLVD